MYRNGTAFYSQRAEAEEDTWKLELQRKAAAILSIEEGQRSGHIGGEGSESKGWKSAGCAYHAVSWDKGKGHACLSGQKPKGKGQAQRDELVAVAKEVFSRRRFVTMWSLRKKSSRYWK